MDDKNAVGQTYESIQSDRFNMYKFRIKLVYIRYDELSDKIEFYIKRIRTLKNQIKKCQRIGSKLGISGKTVNVAGTRPLKAELNMAFESLRMCISKRKEKMKELRNLIRERNDSYDKLNKLRETK